MQKFKTYKNKSKTQPSPIVMSEGYFLICKNFGLSRLHYSLLVLSEQDIRKAEKLSSQLLFLNLVPKVHFYATFIFFKPFQSIYKTIKDVCLIIVGILKKNNIQFPIIANA